MKKHIRQHLLRFTISLLIFISSCGSDEKASPEPNETINSIDEVINDMKLGHEEYAHGTQMHDWGQAPRTSMGNNPGDWTAMITWGQVYESVKGNTATNSRVELRNMKAYYLSKSDNKWHLWQASNNIDGAAYREDFADDDNIEADIRKEPEGTISVTCGNGYNFHFWPASGRVTIDPNDIAGVFTTMQARLILDDPDKEDDRDKAEYLLSIGADYWKDLDAQWDYWKTNGDIGIGRFKYVKKDWRAFNMHTLDEQTLRGNPPPLE